MIYNLGTSAWTEVAGFKVFCYMETEDEAGEEGKKLWAILRWGCKEDTKNLS